MLIYFLFFLLFKRVLKIGRLGLRKVNIGKGREKILTSGASNYFHCVITFAIMYRPFKTMFYIAQCKISAFNFFQFYEAVKIKRTYGL